MKIANIYVEEARYNPRVQATIPAVWMVEYENGFTFAACGKHDAANAAEVRALLVMRGVKVL
jgi:hypothetical protein